MKENETLGERNSGIERFGCLEKTRREEKRERERERERKRERGRDRKGVSEGVRESTSCRRGIRRGEGRGVHIPQTSFQTKNTPKERERFVRPSALILS